MNEKFIREACLELMAFTDVVYLSSIDENDYPKIRAMTNLRNRKQFSRLNDFFNNCDNDYTVYLTTNNSSNKMNQIKDNKKVCLYYCNFAETHGFLIEGKIEIIKDQEIRHILWQDDWIQFYYDGVNGTEYTVLKVIPESGSGWYKNYGKFRFKINQ